jgi:CBS-domain-containing membrane protein
MRRKRSMSVRDRMSRRVTTVSHDATLSAAAKRMRARRIRPLPVVDRARRLVGMVTACARRQALFAPTVQAETADALALLEAAPMSIRDAARLMHERKLGARPVVERERLVGVLTEYRRPARPAGASGPYLFHRDVSLASDDTWPRLTLVHRIGCCRAPAGRCWGHARRRRRAWQ